MDYGQYFADAIDALKAEGRYRVFIDIERKRGQFPRATYHGADGTRDIVVWCSNDYLGMGQHPKVISAMEEAIDRVGAGAGGTRNISGTNHYHVLLENELADLHAKEAALIFTSGYVSNETTLSTLAKLLPDCVHLLGRAQPRYHDRRASVRSGAEKRVFRHNDVAHLEELLQTVDPARPKMSPSSASIPWTATSRRSPNSATLPTNTTRMTYLDEVHAVGIYGERGARHGRARRADATGSTSSRARSARRSA